MYSSYSKCLIGIIISPSLNLIDDMIYKQLKIEPIFNTIAETASHFVKTLPCRLQDRFQRHLYLTNRAASAFPKSPTLLHNCPLPDSFFFYSQIHLRKFYKAYDPQPI